MLEHLAQAVSIVHITMRSFELSQAVEVSSHLLKVRSQGSLVGSITGLLIVVGFVNLFSLRLFQDLSLKSGFNDPEQLVHLLTARSLLLSIRSYRCGGLATRGSRLWRCRLCTLVLHLFAFRFRQLL